ncbi:MAG: Gfo/Idh/MocA family oxidoreductase [Anaerolineaceae bacterium]|nr:Gfo/Idh/MocA family oxidoreductase [Anaerolineaceae bacterium]
MKNTSPVRVAVIGCGGAARDYHIRRTLQGFPEVEIVVVSDPSVSSYETAASIFEEFGKAPPPNETDLSKLLRDYGPHLDVAAIATPHALHLSQTTACLEAGLDVLLEKPMVLNSAQARELIEVRDRTGKLVVIAFDGGLSPFIRIAADMVQSGQIGILRSVNAFVWQDWFKGQIGTWRQNPDISGGGFMFDTGAHMLNSVADIVGEPFTEVIAWVDNLNTSVDIQATIMARLASGAIVTMNGCGDTGVAGCESEIRLFGTEGILRTGIWGEFLEQMGPQESEFHPVSVSRPQSTWGTFLAVRNRQMPNPCPPEIGLRMALLWEAILESSANNGRAVQLSLGSLNI